MLDSLEIKNFRNLKEIRFKSLKRINLFTGKNNTGKSTILDAVSLYASNLELNQIYELLEERGEKNIRKSNDTNNLKCFSSLFTNNEAKYNLENAIVIGEIDNNLLGENSSTEKCVSLRFLKYLDEYDTETSGNGFGIRTKKTIIAESIVKDIEHYKIGIELKVGNKSYVLPLEDKREIQMIPMFTATSYNFEYIRTKDINKTSNSKLWDSITLTEKETYVIKALKIIEPNIERLAFIDENKSERSAIIKLKGNSSVLPLQSMGDGINRILTIILALTNCENGFLLIDEFENGLHYTVQEKLWEVIFNISKALNVQVFATTHSSDCIASFEQVLNTDQNQSDGILIRLEEKNGEIKPVKYDNNELKVAQKFNIETR